jgi:DNA-binding MarR family transcriptional regulator
LATEESGAAGSQMIDLQRRLFLPQYALSRHVARIEKAGLIRREALTGSGRGAGRPQILHVTDKGRGLRRQVWQIYVAEIQSTFAPRMTTDEAYALTMLLNRLYD